MKKTKFTKKIALLFFLLLNVITTNAKFTSSNSCIRIPLASYQVDKHIKDSTDKADSKETERQNVLKIAKHNKELDDYRNKHEWNWIPTNGKQLSCTLCDDKYALDSVYCINIKNDSIIYSILNNGKLGIQYVIIHTCKIPQDLATDSSFLYHYEAYKDSLLYRYKITPGFIIGTDCENYAGYTRQIQQLAPYGYIEKWAWGVNDSTIILNFKYTNTSEKTIRYIDIYFKTTNAAKEVTCVGNFRGTGPIKVFHTANWKWDSSSYHAAKDTKSMGITKLIITYMNGTKKVLTDDQLQVNGEDDCQELFFHDDDTEEKL